MYLTRRPFRGFSLLLSHLTRGQVLVWLCRPALDGSLPVVAQVILLSPPGIVVRHLALPVRLLLLPLKSGENLLCAGLVSQRYTQYGL